MINFESLHIGITNKCVLACPECTRTHEVGDKTGMVNTLRDIDHSVLLNFIKKSNTKRILFCGNWGDPIYSTDFIELVTAIKNNNENCSIIIHTNGFGKNTAWWTRLALALHSNDTLAFSIDGLPTNYNMYRINSKWENVNAAIQAVVLAKKKSASPVKLVWKYIVFSFNEYDIPAAYDISKDLGFDDLVLVEAMIAENENFRPTQPFAVVTKILNDKKSCTTL